MAQRKPNKIVLAGVLLLHIFVTTMTWRDLNRRSAGTVRGNKLFWRLASAANTTGSLAYFLVGRKSSSGGS